MLLSLAQFTFYNSTVQRKSIEKFTRRGEERKKEGITAITSKIVAR